MIWWCAGKPDVPPYSRNQSIQGNIATPAQWQVCVPPCTLVCTAVDTWGGQPNGTQIIIGYRKSFSSYEHQILNIWVLIIINLLERWTFLTPGALIILCFYIWSCPLLHSEGHCLFYNIGTVVPSRDRDKQCQKNMFSCDDCIFEILDGSSTTKNMSEYLKVTVTVTYLCLLVGFPWPWWWLSPAL